MTIIVKTPKGFELQVSRHELHFLLNAIKEMCKSLGDFGFHARIGSYPEEVKLLVNYLFNQVNHIEQEQNTNIQLSLEQLEILNNTLNEVCNGIKIENFEDKIGVSREVAKNELKIINSLIKEIKSSLDQNDDDLGVIQRTIPIENTELNQKIVCFETDGYKIDFFLRTSQRLVNFVDIIIILDSKIELGKLHLKTLGGMTSQRNLLDLTQYLEQHIDKLQQNPGHISSPFLIDASLFKVQAMAMDWTAKNEQTFTLQFMLNAYNRQAKDNIGTYIGVEARITFQKIRDFISNMREALSQLSD
jgi:hypothetical protein